ncbi:alpha/beta hydrolase family protein [Xanthovirga aplysinae]|uniref:alpha/beta hydrolase family protein n=1 Tax=Xanthovirga aplysinae TaxID=2529853 RepID=UPI0012BBA6B4|nr:hypothetical protein [Xanthovirga aplysinae]MTI31671.1 hypothetical protein [Xanthovirga aplysinae]
MKKNIESRINQRLKYLLIFLMGISFLTGCNKDESEKIDPIIEEEEGISDGTEDTFLEIDPNGQVILTKEMLQAQLAELGLSELVPNVRYGILKNTVFYKSSFRGKEITASGAVLSPLLEDGEELSNPYTFLYSHGTAFSKLQAPSSFSLENEISLYALEVAPAFVATGMGYVFLPDYPGLGIKDGVAVQPYFLKEASAADSKNMLLAADESLRALGHTPPTEFVLTGHSQGAYNTLAILEKLQQSPLKTDPAFIGASAGIYDPQFLSSILTQAPAFSRPSFLALIVKSYKENNPELFANITYSDIFNAPYDQLIATMDMNGDLISQQIDAMLPTQLSGEGGLLQVGFLQMLQNENSPISQAFAANAVLGLNPNGQDGIIMHSDQDEVVPYQSSVQAFEILKMQGASELELVIEANGGHAESIAPFIYEFSEALLQLN